jgi:hypothetical protein
LTKIDAEAAATKTAAMLATIGQKRCPRRKPRRAERHMLTVNQPTAKITNADPNNEIRF